KRPRLRPQCRRRLAIASAASLAPTPRKVDSVGAGPEVFGTKPPRDRVTFLLLFLLAILLFVALLLVRP
ncbi:MAG: hypothetical protein WBG92_23835, partial [Thiohalocapsa sp.]